MPPDRPRLQLQFIIPHAGIAQLVERQIENLRVGGSIPSPGTNSFNAFWCGRRQVG